MSNDCIRLLETVADIAWLAGAKDYHTGDSRADIADFIAWAKEFETEFKRKVEADEAAEDDYMEAIEEFALAKIDGRGEPDVNAELLEVLQACLDNDWLVGDGEAFERVENAIAKARGTS